MQQLFRQGEPALTTFQPIINPVIRSVQGGQDEVNATQLQYGTVLAYILLFTHNAWYTSLLGRQVTLRGKEQRRKSRPRWESNPCSLAL